MNPEPQQDSPINLLVLLIKHHIHKCKFPNGLPSISEVPWKSLLIMVVNYISGCVGCGCCRGTRAGRGGTGALPRAPLTSG